MPIDSEIRNLIIAKGFITVDRMMREVLTSNPGSYYQQQNIIGEQGDFITSPEISQLFGEIIGLWGIEQWEKMGKPKRTNLVELGPGRGVLMRDLLKVAKLVPDFYDSIKLELIEINPNFIEQQRKNLDKFDKEITWHQQVTQITELPSIIIANEFFDALPIKQYLKVKELWYESIFIADPIDGKIKYDKIGISSELQTQLQQDHPNAHDGAILEESLQSLEHIRFIAEHLKKFTGACLIIDYGYDIPLLERTRHHYTPTLQAVRTHKYHPLLESLGEADLSVHVDFASLKKAAQEHGATTHGVINQGDFLKSYGIMLRSNLLQKNLPKADQEIIQRQTLRLTSPSQMGNLFKVLQINS